MRKQQTDAVADENKLFRQRQQYAQRYQRWPSL